MTSVFSWIAAVSIISPFILTGQNAKEDYAKLAKELEVKELSTLMFAKYNDENLKKIAVFLMKHPKAPEREKVLYLRAYSF